MASAGALVALDGEIWEPIKGYESLYIVSNLGRVCRILPPCAKHKDMLYRMLKPVRFSAGYYRVTLSKDNVRKPYAIHRLVASAFIPNPKNKPHVNHIDGNKANNSAENLEWVTSAENNQHAYKTGLNVYHPEHLPVLKGESNPKHILTKKDVKEIRELLKQNKYTQKEIGAMYGVSNYAICDIKRNRSWKGVG